MRPWPAPAIPRLPGRGPLPRVHDTATGALAEVGGPRAASLYVCGITPYDATHLGHAATYLAFDTLQRLWLDAGLAVTYLQNVTDVDDPLLERAVATGVPWRELADRETALFAEDMAALGIRPPEHWTAVSEVVAEVAEAVRVLLERGLAYRLGEDLYFDSAAAASQLWRLGTEPRLDRATMLALAGERGGDPERPGKRDPLDPLLWRGSRPRDDPSREPRWPSPLGAGRPGWHIECSVIAGLGTSLPLSVNGGGVDLAFPHHEFSAGHTAALDGVRLALASVHAGLVGYRGEKMSKSLGNLVFVSALRREHDPRAIRLALLAHHYREDWEWHDEELAAAEERLARWSAAARAASAGQPGPVE
ncbi:MAG: cysteine--1-D-myo-inosityl 2-amino-2-deoxy-alpha-D-glucopyranoside ligase, partial [Microbacteriaceae bacterium]